MARKPIVIFIPQLFDEELDCALKENPPKFSYQRNQFNYIVFYILLMRLSNKKNEVMYLNKQRLKKIIHSQHHKFLKYLKDNELIECDGLYSPNKKAYGYNVSKKHMLSGHKKIEIGWEDYMYKKILKYQENSRSHYNRLDPHLKQMREVFWDLELDYERAVAWAETHPEVENRLCYLIAINNFHDRRFRYFKRNSTNGRLDTNLTNISKEVRQFLGQKLISIDLKNSQPFLLGILLQSIITTDSTLCYKLGIDELYKSFGVKGVKKVQDVHHNHEKGNLVSFSEYFESVKSGVFYESFIEKYGNILRDDVKDLMFKILFSRNSCWTKKGAFLIPYKEDKEKFGEVHPFVLEACKILKSQKDKHNALAIYLQELESYLFIDCISKELVKEGIIPLTIHDSVLVKPEDADRTFEIMNEVFEKELGVIPIFEAEMMY